MAFASHLCVGQEDNPSVNTAEVAIPVGYPAARYQEVWEKSPFQFEAAGEIVVAPVSFARDYVLTGLIQDGDTSIAYIQNKKTGAMKRIASGEPVDGFELVSATPSPDPHGASIVIRRGSENATLSYDDADFLQAVVRPTEAPGTPSAVAASRAGARFTSARNGNAPPQPMTLSPEGQPIEPPTIPRTAPEGAAPILNPAAARLQARPEGQPAAERSQPTPNSRRRIYLPTAPEAK